MFCCRDLYVFCQHGPSKNRGANRDPRNMYGLQRDIAGPSWGFSRRNLVKDLGFRG